MIYITPPVATCLFHNVNVDLASKLNHVLNKEVRCLRSRGKTGDADTQASIRETVSGGYLAISRALGKRMGNAATIDLQRLLQPIPGSSPTGIDLRGQNPDSHESVYWQLRSARNESGEIERKHLTDPANAEYDLNRCRWSEIISKAVDVLAQQSKDLEVAAWLCDSLLRVHGFAGLRDGLRLTRELVEKYWDGLYPALDASGEGVAARLNQYGGLFRARQHPALRVPFTENEKFAELDYEQAQILDKLADPKEKQARIAKGELTMQKFTEAVRETSTPFLKALVEDIEESLVEGEKLVAVLKPKCGKNERGEDVAPSAREFTEVLKKVLSVVRLVAGDRIGREGGPGGLAPKRTAKSKRAARLPAAQPKELTRETALARFRELADFFRRSEPHSPISHHLEEAVRWGQLPLAGFARRVDPRRESPKRIVHSHRHCRAGQEIAEGAVLPPALSTGRGADRPTFHVVAYRFHKPRSGRIGHVEYFHPARAAKSAASPRANQL